MKRILPLLAACVLSGVSTFAASRYWIGSANSNWNNPSNWSAEADGTPGASVPGIADDVFFEKDAVVLMDVAGSVNSFNVSLLRNVTLYTGLPVSLTISGTLSLAPGSVLKDSTSQPVAFPVIFNPATNAGAIIQGFWIFAGNNPSAIASEDGANFIASSTNRVKVLSSTFAGAESKIISRQFAGNIIAADSALEFGDRTYFDVDGDLNPTVPNARWNTNSNLRFLGNLSKVTHGGARPLYGNLSVNLSSLAADASLELPNGCEVRGPFNITNTNGYTLNLLSAVSSANRVDVVLRNSLNLSGINTNVAMATATAATAQTAYQMAVSLDFTQSGGNFSLQDFNGVTGSSTMVLGRDLRQTAGTMLTRSNATGSASFVIDMDYNFGGSMNFDREQVIRMSSGTIDNLQHMVTLKINSKTEYTGVTLQSPLSTGRIEFVRGPLTTTSVNIITINNPAPDAVKTGVSNGYVNGPLRLTTNSTNRYTLPTGKNTLVMTPAYIYPVSSALSVYQAEYYRNGYSDVSNVSVPLAGVAQNMYWNIEKLAGSDASVELRLNSTVEGAGSNDLYVLARYASNTWINEGNGRPVFGMVLPDSVRSRNLTAYGAFTIGYISIGGGALPVKLTSFDAVKQNQGANVTWKAEELPARFDIQRSTDGRNFITIGTVAAFSGKSQYNFFDASLPQGFIYYRLQSFEKDGSSTFSKIATVLNKESSASTASLLPTLVNSQARFSITSAKAGRLNLVVTDMLGRSVKHFQFEVSTSQFETSLDLGSLKPGAYQVSSQINGVASGTVRFVKN